MNAAAVVLRSFSFEQHPVRTLLRDGEPWFVAADVCAVLGYTNASKAIADHLEADDRSNEQLDRSRMGSKAVIISEAGLYALVLRSRKPAARKFAKWVTRDVLPSIRKTGAYRPVNLEPSATAAQLSAARNRRAHELAMAYEATLIAAIRRDEPPTLDAIMAWQPADAAPTPGPSLTREQWLLLVNQAQKAQRLADAALTDVAQALWYAKHVTQIINAAAQFDPERDAICRRIAHEDSRAAA